MQHQDANRRDLRIPSTKPIKTLKLKRRSPKGTRQWSMTQEDKKQSRHHEHTFKLTCKASQNSGNETETSLKPLNDACEETSKRYRRFQWKRFIYGTRVIATHWLGANYVPGDKNTATEDRPDGLPIGSDVVLFKLSFHRIDMNDLTPGRWIVRGEKRSCNLPLARNGATTPPKRWAPALLESRDRSAEVLQFLCRKATVLPHTAISPHNSFVQLFIETNLSKQPFSTSDP